MDWQRPYTHENSLKIPENWLFLHYYEALNVLFRIENALRILVYVVFKNEKRDKWADISISSDEATETTIGALAKKRIAQHQTFGYLGCPIEAPIMHLTSGELVRLLTSDPYWPLFKDFFLASKQVVTLKLQEIGDIRNSLAHFRPITEDDVEAVKQNSKQVLSSVENALGSMILCSQRVPSNTPEKWYQELRTLGTDICSLEFNQSTDSRWIRFTMRFNARIIAQSPDDPKRIIHYQVLNVDTPEILKKYDDLRSLTIYLTERVPSINMPQNYKPSLHKRLQFTFSRPTLTREYEVIRENVKRLLAEIDNEAELLAEDNLAKGDLLHLVRVVAVRAGGGPHTSETHRTWDLILDNLRCRVESHHPTEYWGSIALPMKDLVSDSEQFPWMPISISESEAPF